MHVTARSTQLFAVAVLTALALAVGYARWSEQLKVSTTITTIADSQFNADFTHAWTDDPPCALDPGYAKDVACSRAELVDTDCDCRNELVSAKVYNAYPCYTTRVSMCVHNGGCMPERIASVIMNVPPELEVTLTDVAGRVLAPGEEVEVVATVHVRQSAAMLTAYQFDIRLECTQSASGEPAHRQAQLLPCEPREGA